MCSVLGGLVTAASAAPPRPGAGEPSPGLLEGYTSYPERTDPEALTLLGRKKHVSAAQRLVLLSRDLELRSNPRAALALVRALHTHARGPERERVVRALLSFFRLARPNEAAAWGEHARRIRGSAALALAASAHPTALRELVVLARSGSDFDPELGELASEAVAAHPPSAELNAALGLPPAPPRTSTPALSLDPRALSRVTHETELTALLEAFAAAPCEAAALGDDAAWREALATERAAWALRALTLTGLRCAGPRERAKKEAARLRAHPSPSVRAAAAQARAIFEPERAASELTHEDPVLVRAVLAQSHGGVLAERARSRALERFAAESALSADDVAWLVAFDVDHPLPLRLLSSRENEPLFASAARGLLAARARDGELPVTGPSFERVGLWLEKAPPLERSAVARGLGSVDAPRALGLLLEAYEDENDAAVRRALLSSLGRRRARVPARVFEEARDLDPDPLCRAFGRAALADDDAPAESSLTRPYAFEILPLARLGDDAPVELVLFGTVDGRTIPVLAAPDGFALVTGLPFPRPKINEGSHAPGARPRP